MRSDPRLGRVTLGNSVLGTVQLLEEVAVSQYALHAGLHLQHIKSVWRDLWGHVATQLQTGKVRSRTSLASYDRLLRSGQQDLITLVLHTGSPVARHWQHSAAIWRGLHTAAPSSCSTPGQ